MRAAEAPLEDRAPVTAPALVLSRRRLWVERLAIGFAAATAAGLVMGVPTDVVPNGWFTRMTPVRPLDIVLLVLTALALGALAASYVRAHSAPRIGSCAAGGLLTGLAIGCPICNKLVVALVGTSGALSWFAPLQPIIGTAGLGLALWALVIQTRPRSTCET